MRRSDDIPPVGLAVLLVIVFFGIFFYWKALENDCAGKGGHLVTVKVKTWVCVTDDGRILE
jgi:hypothetical protein